MQNISDYHQSINSVENELLVGVALADLLRIH